MLLSEKLDNSVEQNMDFSYRCEDSFMNQYIQYLKQNIAVISRYRRLCRTLPRDPRIILKADLLPTLPKSDQFAYFDMKERYQIRMKDDVLDCISEISTADNPYVEAKKWNNLPWFSIFVKENGIFTVKYKSFSYSFIPIKKVFPNEISVVKQLHIESTPNWFYQENGYNAHAPGNLDYACHFSSENFGKIMSNIYAVTSLCPHVIQNGFWYHSFNLVKNQNEVWDVANGFIMDYDFFQELLEPIVLDQTLGENITKRQNDLIQSGVPFYSEYSEISPLKAFSLQNFDHLPSSEQKNILSRVLKFQVGNLEG